MAGFLSNLGIFFSKATNRTSLSNHPWASRQHYLERVSDCFLKGVLYEEILNTKICMRMVGYYSIKCIGLKQTWGVAQAK